MPSGTRKLPGHAQSFLETQSNTKTHRNYEHDVHEQTTATNTKVITDDRMVSGINTYFNLEDRMVSGINTYFNLEDRMVSGMNTETINRSETNTKEQEINTGKTD